MKTKLVFMLLLLALLAGNGYAIQAAPAGAALPSTVGVIHWAGWYSNPPNPSEAYLSPAQWHPRLPFFAQVIDSSQVQVREDSQGIIDQEIELAHAAGIDYWAIDYNAPADTDPDISCGCAYGLHFYLSSPYKNDLNFALVLIGGASLGKLEDWTTKTIPRIVQLLEDPTYQKVKGNRPLIYLFSLYKLIDYFGSGYNARAALQELRDAATSAGLTNPYIVGQVFDSSQEAHLIRDLSLDALSAYSAVATKGGFRELPYQRLVQTNRTFWNRALTTGLKLVVSINTGWDARPRMIDPVLADRYGHSPYYTQATPAQIAAHLKNALNWSTAHRKVTEANTVLVYAWNEIDEGGWLLPTLDGGNARLDAIGRVLNARKPR
jgi:hypothetical protein